MRSLIFLLLLSSQAFAALSIRDLDGDTSNGYEGVYDDVLDITWLADANYAYTSNYDDDGQMSWNDSLNWANNLFIGNYTNWRLPEANPIDGTTSDDSILSRIGSEDFGHNISAPGTEFAGSTASEMAHLFHNTLQGVDSCHLNYSTWGCNTRPDGFHGLTSSGPFSNIQWATRGYDKPIYWTASHYAPNNNISSWYFDFGLGSQAADNKNNPHYAWAVHDGDIGNPVPLPAGIYLFLSGLVGLGLMRGRNA